MYSMVTKKKHVGILTLEVPEMEIAEFANCIYILLVALHWLPSSL